MNYNIQFFYDIDGVGKDATGSNEDFDVELIVDNSRLKLTIFPHKRIDNMFFYVERDYIYSEDSKFFANGFQSWTDSREFSKHEKMDGLGLIGKIARPFGLKYVGDYTFTGENKKVGDFSSISFAYVRNGDTLDFIGSLDDRTGYTIINAQMDNNQMVYSKDLDGVEISEEYVLLDLYFDSGKYEEVFDRYFEKLGVKPLTDKKIKGYTSWYNYYQSISEDIILRDLNSLSKEIQYVNTFQVDDGYQTKVGDWLIVDKKKFPNGMGYIADKIHEQGLQAGLWLNPFGAQKDSRLVKEHPDWFIHDEKGKLLCVGANWGGFYPLNIENENAREYVRHVFDVVLNEWGFDLVKLDFLYCTAVIPINGKSRGQLAYETIDFLRECVGNKQILGCGVQQMPCFGKVEYMRIGPDMSLGWAHDWKRKLMHREDVPTPNAIFNSIYRRCLNNRAFLCDPDVFLLRKTNIKFTPQQQKVLSLFIKLFGSVLFMSDNISDYDEEQLNTFRDILTDDCKLVDVIENEGVVDITYQQNNIEMKLSFNANTGELY